MPAPNEPFRPLLPPAVARGGPTVSAFVLGALVVGALGSIITMLASAVVTGPSASRSLLAGCFAAAALASCALLGYLPILARLGPLSRESEPALFRIAFVTGAVSAGCGLALLWLGRSSEAMLCLGLVAAPLFASALGWLLLNTALHREWIAPHVHGAHCSMCGHDIQGLASDRCPECGALLPVASGPWRRLAALTSRRATDAPAAEPDRGTDGDRE